MKIATLLAVGGHIATHKMIDTPKHLDSAFDSYKQINNINWSNQSLSEVIPNIFTTLNEFLGK